MSLRTATPMAPERFHRRRNVVRLAALLAAVALGNGCGDGGTPSGPPPPEPLRATTVAVSPATVELAALGETDQLSAEVRDQNGNVMTGASVAWASGDASVATVDASGLVTAAGNGTATITATAGSASGSATVTVAQRVSAVAISPAAETLVALGDTLRLAAVALDGNGHAVAATEFEWASGDTLVATVDTAGLVTAVGSGTATVAATAGPASGSATVTVAQQVTAVEVPPIGDTLAALGDTLRLTATATDANGHPVVGTEFAWVSADTRVATVDSTGLVTAAGNGTAAITATAGEASDSATAVVRQAVSVVNLGLDWAPVVVGDTLRLSAKATDANGHGVGDAALEWSSSAPAVAPVDANGLMRGVSKGTTIITARSGAAADSATVVVDTSLPPAVTVAFVENSVRISEGEEAAVGIRYRVWGLDQPLAIEVSAREDGAEAADYELSGIRFEIPAARGAEETLDLVVAARADGAFTEGEEGIELALSVPGATDADVGGPLPVRIADAPAAACVGVNLAATPPEPVAQPAGLRSLLEERDRIRTWLTSEWHPSAREVTMRWAGPYNGVWDWFDFEHHPWYTEDAKPFPLQPDFHIKTWRFDPGEASTRHVMDISWSAEADLELVFRCGTGDVAAACDAEGCRIREMAASRSTSPQSDHTSLSNPSIGGLPTPASSTVQASIPDASAPHPFSSSPNLNAYLLYPGWHPSVWPPGDTLVFYLSTVNWPDDARMTPVEMKELLEGMLAEWSAIPTADIAWRVEGPVDGLQPGRDGKNIFFMDPGYVHGGGPVTGWYDEIDGVWGKVESDHKLGSPEAARFTRDRYDWPWPYIANELGMHPLGHLLELGHAGTFPAFASCPGTTVNDCGRVEGNLDYWRGVSGAWQFDPIMSYGASGTLTFLEDGSTLRLDDKIGASLLRPAPGWLETTGTIAGSVRTDDGRPVPHIHVWAVRPDERGLMDGVGSFADRNGDFLIQGLPRGDWILIAHPDLSWVANPRFFLERQGELTDEMLLFPVRTVAGQTTGGIEITMSRGRMTTVR